MRIVCPACAAIYEVPDDRLHPGRAVQCARCETDWVPLVDAAPEPTPEPALELPAESAPDPALEVRDAEPVAYSEAELGSARPTGEPRRVGRARKGSILAVRLAWALSLALVAAVVVVAVSARETIMRTWPPSIRAYAAIGLPERHSEPPRPE